MYKISKIVLFAFLILLIIITFLGYGDTGKIFYTSESATYLTEVSNINIILSIVFLLFFAFISLYRFNNRVLKASLLIVAFLLWLLAGRKVGVKAFEDGRVNYGWYCFEVERLFLCDNQDPKCETIIANKTFIEKLSFWRIKIENKDVNRTVFIGPVAWDQAIGVLENTIGNGTYTK